jgi:hypothetical protein
VGVFNLIAVKLFGLRYFRFGPFEWLWRSLTYWEKTTDVEKKENSQQLKAGTSTGSGNLKFAFILLVLLTSLLHRSHFAL